MGSLKDHRVLVVGAGVVGCAVALDLARHGATVSLIDLGSDRPNASRVAAGMLAPVMESLLDPLSADHLPLLRRARDLWPTFALHTNLFVRRCGAVMFAANPQEHDRARVRLESLGAAFEELSVHQAEALSPGLKGPGGAALFTSEDWRIYAPQALDALQSAVGEHGGEVRPAQLASLRGAVAELSDGSRLHADAVVLATGLAPRSTRVDLPELSALSPIKGQLVRFTGAGPEGGPTVRAPGGYAVPGADGLVVGATMEAGLDDVEPDQAATAGFAELGRRLFPALEGRRATAMAAVRASTPDGLPLVGASSQPGVFLALAARRNGWLLAPLMAEILRASLETGAKDVCFDPLRFTSTAG